jgi:hypothetical protein
MNVNQSPTTCQNQEVVNSKYPNFKFLAINIVSYIHAGHVWKLLEIQAEQAYKCKQPIKYDNSEIIGHQIH